MKNQYFADINDYRKYGLLRTLVGDGGLTSAVCWMLTQDDGRTDGQHVGYLDDPGKWRKYDPPLFDSLASCMADLANRTVEWAEAKRLIPSAVYLPELLTDRRLERERYLRAFNALAAGRDLVFFDPDNGIEVKSTPYGARGSRKYLYWRELADVFNSGHSVLVYQHFNRIKRQTFIGQIVDGIRNCLDAPEVVTFSTPNVLFLLAVQPKHQALLTERCSRVAAIWGSQIGVHRHQCAVATPATSFGAEGAPPGEGALNDIEEQNKIGGLASQIIGNVGLYYVCYRLSCRGWNVMPTARNARGVDVLIYSHDAARKLSIQVKALSKRSPVPLGAKLEHLFADFVVICRHAPQDRPECFVLTPEEVRRLAHRGEKDGRVSYWLQPREYEAGEYYEAWDRIGTGG